MTKNIILSEINGAKLMAQATTHMLASDRKGMATTRAYFLTVPVLPGSDMASVAKAIEIAIRKSFAFSGEKSSTKKEASIGLITCPDYLGTRSHFHLDTLEYRDYPHFHLILFLPRWLAATSSREEREINKSVQDCLCRISEVKAAVSNCGELDSVYMQRIYQSKRSIFYTIDYSVKASKKMADFVQSGEYRIFPYYANIQKNPYNIDEIDSKVKKIASKFLLSSPKVQFPPSLGKDNDKKQLWLSNNL
ncbi:hypothetical protein [Thalassovita sp.]|uniref:hypothetical protein n=1 Tax=Thalassovita sp. TaxID=1979401 RepID=UPI002B26957F|nr:hypothetical protein [Thalassovita sp.]